MGKRDVLEGVPGPRTLERLPERAEQPSYRSSECVVDGLGHETKKSSTPGINSTEGPAEALEQDIPATMGAEVAVEAQQGVLGDP